jgi:glycosyltransferase involved in cell wall biosynthesis
VVPAFNEERLLGVTLTSLRECLKVFSGAGWETELIVCDNNSTDRTAELARGAGAIVVFEPINQIARARNRGAEAAKGDWLLFVDADSQPSSALFREVVQAIQSGKYLAGGCTVKMEGNYPVAARVAKIWNGISRGLRLMAGSFIFCESSAFNNVGGFSHELFAGEELELSQKLKKLARRRRQKLIILHRNPLLTSARKLHLYRTRDYLWFFLKATVAHRRVLTDRAQCYPWYDGRR